MIEFRKAIIFLFVTILLFFMSRLVYFIKKKWQLKLHTFITLLCGIIFIFLATFLDMLSTFIHNPLIYTIIKLFFTFGAVVYIIGIILWTKFTIEIMNDLEMTTLKDSLTGVLNRAGIEKSYKSLSKANTPFYIIVCDLNGTKRINDTYGHIKGDEYIIKTTDIIAKIIGLKGHLSRVGGDEFIILLEHIELKELQYIISNIKKLVSEIYINEETGISIGYALFPVDGMLFKDLIEFADSRMYDDKKNTKLIG